MTKRLIRVGGAAHINKSCVLLFLVYLLTSCATTRLADVEELPGNKPVVFGRIKVIENGQPTDWDRTWPEFGVYIIPDAGPEPIPYFYVLKGDGSFYWSLSPGGYLITEFQRRVGFRLDHVRRGILASFAIREAMSSSYIGTLTILSEAGRYTMDVEDEYDEALQRLKQQFPEFKGPVAKRLMQLELR